MRRGSAAPSRLLVQQLKFYFNNNRDCVKMKVLAWKC